MKYFMLLMFVIFLSINLTFSVFNIRLTIEGGLQLRKHGGKKNHWKNVSKKELLAYLGLVFLSGSKGN